MKFFIALNYATSVIGLPRIIRLPTFGCFCMLCIDLAGVSTYPCNNSLSVLLTWILVSILIGPFLNIRAKAVSTDQMLIEVRSNVVKSSNVLLINKKCSISQTLYFSSLWQKLLKIATVKK
jgi:hypothetical protein